MKKREETNHLSGRSFKSAPNEEKILVVADDFTGANDTGVQFSKRNLRSVVITDLRKINKSFLDCDVLVVDTESRFDEPEKAYKKTYKIGVTVKRENLRCIYKKLDSTFRGNIGAEISGLMDSLGIQNILIVPAYPTYQRITKNGMVYVKGKLLEETEFSSDPRTPVKNSFIPEIISLQTDKTIGLINVNEVRAGKQNLSDKIHQYISKGTQLIVIDAEYNSDLDRIASVSSPLSEKVLFAGSTGFAEFLSKYLDLKKKRKSNVVIAGSLSDVTRRQIEFVRDRLDVRLIDIDIDKVFSPERDQEKSRILQEVEVSSIIGEDFIIKSSRYREVVNKKIEKDKISGLKDPETGEAIALFLGEIARDIIHNFRINGILLTGGDIAIKASQALNSKGTVLYGEVLPGIPYGSILEKEYKDLIVVTKAGGFGNEDAIFHVLNFLSDKTKK